MHIQSVFDQCYIFVLLVRKYKRTLFRSKKYINLMKISFVKFYIVSKCYGAADDSHVYPWDHFVRPIGDCHARIRNGLSFLYSL